MHWDLAYKNITTVYSNAKILSVLIIRTSRRIEIQFVSEFEIRAKRTVKTLFGHVRRH
jgi:hypothetical protein